MARRDAVAVALELLIDREEDRVLRAVLIGMLREAEREGQRGFNALRSLYR